MEKPPIDFLEWKRKKALKDKKRDPDSSDKSARRAFFIRSIRNVEAVSGINKYRQLENFMEKVKFLKPSEETDPEDAIKLNDQELKAELLNTDETNWKLRPIYYRIVYQRIKEIL